MTEVNLATSISIVANGKKLGRVIRFRFEANLNDNSTKVHLTFNLGMLAKDNENRIIERTYRLKAGSFKVDKKLSANPDSKATADTISFDTIEPLDLPF